MVTPSLGAATLIFPEQPEPVRRATIAIKGNIVLFVYIIICYSPRIYDSRKRHVLVDMADSWGNAKKRGFYG